MADYSLPRLPIGTVLIEPNGSANFAFALFWNVFAETIETLLTNLDTVVDDLAANVAAIQAAQDAADAAQAAADAADALAAAAAADAATAQSTANTATSAISDINDDTILSPVEKPVWIKVYADLLAEQSDIDTKATAYGITTEKTNYDNAVSALTTYLNGLTTAVAWNNTSGNTTIVPATFRSKFTDVETKKRLLLNKMHNTSKTLADDAQADANSAQSTANAAQNDANDALSDAAAAQSDANAAQADANDALADLTVVKRNDAISSSYTKPGEVLTAADVGSNCTITVAAHVRAYGDGTTLSVSGGSLTAASFSTTYYIYYTDTTRADTTPTYQKTTNPNDAMPNKATGRHYVGKVTTPADGGGSTTGGTAPPSGGGNIPAFDVPGS